MGCFIIGRGDPRPSFTYHIYLVMGIAYRRVCYGETAASVNLR